MKRVLLLASFFGALAANAQTVTADDSLHTGDIIDYWVMDSTVNNLDAISGAGVTWDYSAITAYAIGSKADNIVDAAGTTWDADFPESDYMEDLTDGVKTYFRHTADEMIVDGFTYDDGTNVIVVKYDDDSLTALEYPMAQGDSYTDDIAGTGSTDALAFDVDLIGTATVNADGSGTLTVGSTDFTDVLRVKTTETSSGTALGITISISRVSYAYYQPGGSNDMPIFRTDSINADLGIAGVTSYKSAFSSVEITTYIGEEELQTVEDFKIFPNPADENATVVMGKDVEVMTMYNALGEQVYQIVEPSMNVVINTAAYTPGVYFVELKQGDAKSTQKLVIK